MTDAAIPATPEISTAELARREKGRSDRACLMKWLLALENNFHQGRVLFTQDPNTGGWQMTGFLTKEGKLHAKLGDNLYQPLGTLDDEVFYPSQASKLLWIRNFAMAELQAVKPPFDVAEATQADFHDPENPSALTDRDRKELAETFDQLAQDLQVLAAAEDEGESTTITEAGEKLILTVQMGAARNRRLDDRLRRFAQENPELGLKDEKTGIITDLDYSGKVFRPQELGKLVSEFIRLKLNDDSARRFVLSNDLVATNHATYAEVVDGLLKQLAELIPQEGGALNAEAAASALSSARTVVPALKPIIEPFVDSNDILGALKASAAELMKILAAAAPAAVQPEITPGLLPSGTGAEPAPTGEATPAP